ncbi:GIY-YIG nuclease family protein [Lactobacillus reuteri]|uniref:GIY-YIG nuclease family protein n=1 Tax=Limosilactobacillus reuteri TaxID=1598 RepID=A0A6L5P4C3_LIMRT|nr:GIY-YIG nuclease family protein [Limosilactobacillus reuteri]MCR1878978.1 GIY-YIG nuclease family protein [Limosilactobacillus reuteri]MRH09106.1 GIY-YIG nuclease family protein [Limosilactobacillus reuteri]NDO58045.1 GIY-YIG nuclease family protein [Limosilactobacillus reuteri]
MSEEKQLTLNQLLNLDNQQLSVAKVKFNQNNGEVEPINDFLNDPEMVNNQWLFWRNKNRYFNVGDLAICLIKLRNDQWLLTTIKKVTKELDVTKGVNYEGQELAEYKALYGRVVLQYHKGHQVQVRKFQGIEDQLIVSQILPTVYDGTVFPGYDNICLSYDQLADIIKKEPMDWINALKAQKAVYLITDKATGKLYVGSATGKEMLLERWQNYVDNGHGGNKDLVRLVEEEGFDYIKKNFQYSLLENFNSVVDDNIVLEREKWWKKVLRSREYGYNKN